VAQKRQSRPDSGLDVQVKDPKTLYVAPSSLGRGGTSAARVPSLIKETQCSPSAFFPSRTPTPLLSGFSRSGCASAHCQSDRNSLLPKCLKQSISRPCVVQIWSRNTQIVEPTKVSKSTVWLGGSVRNVARGRDTLSGALTSNASSSVSNKVFLKSFCASQFPHKSVNIYFI